MHLARNGARTRVVHVFAARCSAAAPKCERSKCCGRLDSLRFSFRDGGAERRAGRAGGAGRGPRVSSWNRVCSALAFTGRFTALLRRLEVDVLHSHVHYASGYLLWLAKRAGVRQRIADFRNTSDSQGHGLRAAIATRRHAPHARSLCDGHPCGQRKAPMVEAWCADWPAELRCRVILNGLDTAGSRQRWRLAMCARFGWSANQYGLCQRRLRSNRRKNQLRVSTCSITSRSGRPERVCSWSAVR